MSPGTRTAILFLIPLLISCATRQPVVQMGPDAEVTFDGLHRVDDSMFQRAWVRPGADLSGYTKALLLDSGIHYKRTEAQRRVGFEVSEQQMEQTRNDLHQAFVKALETDEAWQVVSERGPDVLSVRIALIDVVATAGPTDPSGRDIQLVESVGEATLVIELHDSDSKEILARIADRRAAGGSSVASQLNTPTTNRNATRSVFQDWAGRTRTALNRAQSMTIPSE